MVKYKEKYEEALAKLEVLKRQPPEIAQDLLNSLMAHADDLAEVAIYAGLTKASLDNHFPALWGAVGLKLATSPGLGGGKLGVNIAGLSFGAEFGTQTVGLLMLTSLGLAPHLDGIRPWIENQLKTSWDSFQDYECDKKLGFAQMVNRTHRDKWLEVAPFLEGWFIPGVGPGPKYYECVEGFGGGGAGVR